MKYVLLYSALFYITARPAFSQLSYEVYTDKESYDYGESIIITGRVYNNTDTLVTFISDYEGFISPVRFNDAFFTGNTLPLEVPYDLPARSYYTCSFVIDPQQMGLPNKDGINKIICGIHWYFYPQSNGLSTKDTVEFSAPAFYGGQLKVYFSVDSLNLISVIRDSMNATVLESDTSLSTVNELWQSSGFILDSLIARYQNHFIEITPSRDLDWPSMFVTHITEQAVNPSAYTLKQNYPNPFNPLTTIEYTVRPKNSVLKHINLSIYNSLGEKVATLVNQKQSPGNYKVKWDANTMPSGVYFYSLQSADFKQTKKMILIR